MGCPLRTKGGKGDEWLSEWSMVSARVPPSLPQDPPSRPQDPARDSGLGEASGRSAQVDAHSFSVQALTKQRFALLFKASSPDPAMS